MQSDRPGSRENETVPSTGRARRAGESLAKVHELKNEIHVGANAFACLHGVAGVSNMANARFSRVSGAGFEEFISLIHQESKLDHKIRHDDARQPQHAALAVDENLAASTVKVSYCACELGELVQNWQVVGPRDVDVAAALRRIKLGRQVITFAGHINHQVILVNIDRRARVAWVQVEI